MCGGAIKKGLNLFDQATGGIGLGSMATLGLGTLTGFNLQDTLNPKLPDMPEMPTGQAPSGAGVADAAQLAAAARERRRAAARFGRASTIGAGSVGAPAMGGKTAVGS